MNRSHGPDSLSPEEIDRRLNNPLTSLWSLVFQDNFNVKQGSVVDGSTFPNSLFFQPSLPVPFGE